MSPDDLMWVYVHAIKDAFEGRIAGLYNKVTSYSENGEKQIGGPFCMVYPLGQPEIPCTSEEEFNNLALKYFGITP
jgi:hypothetical protein